MLKKIISGILLFVFFSSIYINISFASFSGKHFDHYFQIHECCDDEKHGNKCSFTCCKTNPETYTIISISFPKKDKNYECNFLREYLLKKNNKKRKYIIYFINDQLNYIVFSEYINQYGIIKKLE